MVSPAKPASTISASSARPKNASTAATAIDALSAWCAPCTGTKTCSRDAVRGVQVDEPTADGGEVAVDAELDVARPHLAGLLGQEQRPQVVVGLAQHEERPGLDDAGLLGGDGPTASRRRRRCGRTRRW